MAKINITVTSTINAPVDKVWNLWTDPAHIVHWNQASDDWQTTYAENEPVTGGRFLSRMEARDGSEGFDFTGEYNNVEKNRILEYLLDDNRNVQVTFVPQSNKTVINECFEAEETNPVELQQAGWQAIMNNFKNYAEAYGTLEVLHFEISINSSTDKIYKTLITEDTYREWTSVFNPSSYYIGDWKKGSKIVFLGTDKDGNIGGMVSRIKENITDKFLSIEHLGIVKNGIEITSGSEVEGWKGSLENYTLKPNDGRSLLAIDIDSNQEFRSYFLETWPKALEKLKSICE
jgi:uncharacterized protein YndB with AHSA1/START domain